MSVLACTSADAVGPTAAQLQSARRGELVALEVVAVACRDRAYRLALHLLGDPEEARDVAQDAVVRVLGAIARFDPQRQLDPWLARIVRNLVRDRRRRSRVRRHEALDELAVAVLEAPEGASPEDAAVRSDLQRTVWREVQLLSPDHREVVVLRDYLGLSYEAIATVLGVPRGTVMSRLHRARSALRERVGAAAGEGRP